MERVSMASATVFANKTASMTGVTYVSVPVSCAQRMTQDRQSAHPNLAIDAVLRVHTSNMMTASETVVRVTPASAAAAPTMLYTPGKTHA